MVHDPRTPAGGGEPPTEPVPVTTGEATAPVPAVPVPDQTATVLEPLFAGEPEEWPTGRAGHRLRVSWPVAVFVVLLAAAGGLWGGATLQRHQASSSTGSTAASLRSLFAGRTRSAAGLGSTTSAATTGTVTDIQGDTLYVTEASGNLVAVTVGSQTVVDRNASSSLSALQPGDTVVVEGTKQANGTVAAATVSATQAGVSGGGFGGFGGAGAFGGSGLGG